MTVSRYYTKLRGIWDEVQSINLLPACTCQGCKCEITKEIARSREKERLYDFLMGLNEEYGALRTQILSTDPLPTLNNAYHLLSRDEQEKKIGASRSVMREAAAFYTNNKTAPKIGVKGNSSSNLKKKEERSKNGKNEDIWCSHCHKTRHTLEGCFELIGYPDWWSAKSTTSKNQSGKTRQQQPRAATITGETSQQFPVLAKEDYEKLLQLLKTAKLSEQKINPTANMTDKVERLDNWIIDSGASDHITHLTKWSKTMNNKINNSSVSIPNGKLVTVKGIGDIHISPDLKLKNVLNDLHTKNLIGMGKERDGLYYLEPMEKKKVAMAVLRKYDVWHRRLGHTSEGVLRKIQQIGDVVDDYSRGMWVYLMKNKFDAAQLLVTFYKLIVTQFNKNIKRIRTDNGSEFKCSFMLGFYKDKGILLETLCPYTPQQNGVVERKHRHLLEMGKALRFQASPPIEFWGDCILTATYIINKLPTPVLENKTPREILLGKSPTYEHLWIFGCLAYADNALGKYDKFGDRGRPCIFIGYPMGQKGYKLYDLKDQRIHVTLSVTFTESKSPFGENYEGHKVIANDHLVDALDNI
ncbi:uncharacterized protein LOC128126128 [Lactuca sativa]|uniref:uncharacterized protein LOC128126128 n=1 Tax=Lactuca sativa TaxID=4236 RepID=UPI000CD9F35A|nr:uncharacterized protein LOC128126128 [Lactuca sativa]